MFGINAAYDARQLVSGTGPFVVNPIPSLTPHADNPIFGISPGHTSLEDPYLIDVDGTIYIFYADRNGPGWQREIHCQRCIAYPTVWEDLGIVLAYNTIPSFDPLLVAAPMPYRLPNRDWAMILHGYDGSHDRGGIARTTGAAFPFGWALDASLCPFWDVGPAGTWDDAFIHPQCLLPWSASWDGRTRVLGACARGGFADWNAGPKISGPDGVTGWAQYPGNPRARAGAPGPWASLAVHPIGRILTIDGWYHFAFQGTDVSNDNWRVSTGATRDFLSFFWNPSGVLISPAGSAPWSSGSCEGPCLFRTPDGHIDCWTCSRAPATDVYQIGVYRVGGWS